MEWSLFTSKYRGKVDIWWAMNELLFYMGRPLATGETFIECCPLQGEIRTWGVGNFLYHPSQKWLDLEILILPAPVGLRKYSPSNILETFLVWLPFSTPQFMLAASFSSHPHFVFSSRRSFFNHAPYLLITVRLVGTFI
jgi:hypothetical protein